ncbi:helix-turn-helix domain-containing protein [Chachezhania antarctica]|uniref:helix-turn-helix domain-containing protein n=1 Tax=Chachezhania antarctica TaxID=2340860 RepID=UPI001968F734|nr:helix-turn-helix domain-containing protein [Chachezhania antarctica]
MTSYQPVNSVLRTLEILKVLNRQSVTSVSQLHKLTGLPKPTIVRLLETLIAANYVGRDENGSGYRVTSTVAELSCGFHGAPVVVEAGRPWLQKLTRDLKWPAAIAVPDGSSVVVYDTTCSDSPMSPYHANIRKRLGLISMPLGRAYLAFSAPEEQRLTMRLLETSDHPDKHLMNAPGLIEQLLNTSRSDKFAERVGGEANLVSSGVAVPIYNEGFDKVLATIGITYYTSAVRRKEVVRTYVPHLQAAATGIRETIIRLTGGMQTEPVTEALAL